MVWSLFPEGSAMFSRTSLSLLGGRGLGLTASLLRLPLTPGLPHSPKLFYCKAPNEGETGSSGDVASSASSTPAPPRGGFAKAMAKMEGHENFPRAFKASPLIQMGEPQGKIAEGTIVHIVDDDLYIDFGGKFNCVCPRPHKNGSAYTFGKKVRVMIHDLELSTRFLGAKSDLTILEADCSLLGLARRGEEFK